MFLFCFVLRTYLDRVQLLVCLVELHLSVASLREASDLAVVVEPFLARFLVLPLDQDVRFHWRLRKKRHEGKRLLPKKKKVLSFFLPFFDHSSFLLT